MRRFPRMVSGSLIWLAISLVGCSGQEAPDVDPDAGDDGAAPVTEPGPDPQPDNRDACYPGVLGNNATCVGVIPMAAMDASRVEYLYQDPHTDQSFPGSFDPTHYEAPTHFVDLNVTAGNLRLARNFRLDELMQAFKGRYGVFTPAVVRNLQSMRERLARPLRITSGFRSPTYNSSVGGATWSRHRYGDAFDFQSDEASLDELRAACEALDASFIQVYTGHVHCDWRGNEPDPIFFAGRPARQGSDARLVQQRYQDYYSDRLDIHVNPVARAAGGASQEIVLSTDKPYQEDGGELAYEWDIELPSGEVIQSQARRPVLPLQRGVYQIDVIIGGTLHLSREWSPER